MGSLGERWILESTLPKEKLKDALDFYKYLGDKFFYEDVGEELNNKEYSSLAPEIAI